MARRLQAVHRRSFKASRVPHDSRLTCADAVHDALAAAINDALADRVEVVSFAPMLGRRAPRQFERADAERLHAALAEQFWCTLPTPGTSPVHLMEWRRDMPLGLVVWPANASAPTTAPLPLGKRAAVPQPPPPSVKAPPQPPPVPSPVPPKPPPSHGPTPQHTPLPQGPAPPQQQQQGHVHGTELPVQEDEEEREAVHELVQLRGGWVDEGEARAALEAVGWDVVSADTLLTSGNLELY